MKSRKSLLNSRRAALRSAGDANADIGDLLYEFAAGQPMEVVMPKLREATSLLTQRIHEYNAYTNVLETR